MKIIYEEKIDPEGKIADDGNFKKMTISKMIWTGSIFIHMMTRSYYIRKIEEYELWNLYIINTSFFQPIKVY